MPALVTSTTSGRPWLRVSTWTRLTKAERQVSFQSGLRKSRRRRRHRRPTFCSHLMRPKKKKKKNSFSTLQKSLPALHMAAANGHADAIRLLLSKSADPSPKTKEGGNTPLHWACLNGHAAATTALLEGGASPSALNAADRTPVDEALGGAHQEAILGVMREFAARGAGAGSAEAEAAEAAVEREGDDDGDGGGDGDGDEKMEEEGKA